VNRSGHVIKIDPPAGIAGGEVAVEYGEVSTAVAKKLNVRFNNEAAHITAVNQRRALVQIPDASHSGQATVSTALDGEDYSLGPAASFLIGQKLAGEVHPVTNPAFDPNDGSLFVTRSGSRGEHVPVSLYRYGSNHVLEEFSGEIVNPTSIAFDRTGRMYVTSRLDGTIYRVSETKDVIAFAHDLGIATGLAINRYGEMFVGDRAGTIFQINEIGEAKSWAQHEPSVSAYHLAFGPDDNLYVTGPSVSSFDTITRFDETGLSSVFYRGLGRPQGLAFDRQGNLYVAASFQGRRGIVRISPDGREASIVVAGMNLVGLAFGPSGEMVVASNEAIYSLPLGIYGTLLD
jgi:hypothetical protein